MKKLNIVLIALAILYASFANANCPKLDSIYVNENDHFAAPNPFGVGADWVDPGITDGHKLPATKFWRAIGTLEYGSGIVAKVECAYDVQSYSFSLAPPNFQLYKIDLSSENWVKITQQKPAPLKPTIYYVCTGTNIDDCPFSLAQ